MKPIYLNQQYKWTLNLTLSMPAQQQEKVLGFFPSSFSCILYDAWLFRGKVYGSLCTDMHVDELYKPSSVSNIKIKTLYLTKV